MLLGMLAQTTPQGQAQPFRPGVNQFRAKGVSYRSVLESARVFVRVPPFPVSPPLSRSSEGQAKSEMGTSCADTATSPSLDCPVASRRGPDVIVARLGLPRRLFCRTPSPSPVLAIRWTPFSPAARPLSTPPALPCCRNRRLLLLRLPHVVLLAPHRPLPGASCKDCPSRSPAIEV
jgi:hypothetical protein